MSKLLETSKKYKSQADKIIKDSLLIESLKKYGEVHIMGAYAGNVMMHGDIDIMVTRDKPYSLLDIFKIFKKLYFERKFKCYFLDGDWDNPKKGKEFPDGQYIGLKNRIKDEKWKIDIWFVSKKEFSKRTNLLSIDKVELNDKDREKILFFKEYRKTNKLEIMGQTIYEAVLNGKCKTIKEFQDYLNKK